MKPFVRNMIIVALVSFVLQYAWEYIQCGLFYTMENTTNYTGVMMSATFGDVMMTVVLYGLLVWVNRDADWIMKKWDTKEYVIMILYAFFLSFYFEISALYQGRWGYTSKMPLIPTTNIAVLPVIQLLILFPISFYISKRIAKYFFKKSRI